MKLILLALILSITHNANAAKITEIGNGFRLDCKDKNGNHGSYEGGAEGYYSTYAGALEASKYCKYGIASIKKGESSRDIKFPKQ